MPPIAHLVLGYGAVGEPPRRRRNYDGEQGERYYWVDTHDADRALAAIGLPQIDDPWDPDTAPELKLVEQETRYIGGTDNTVTGVGGVTSIRCIYETPGYHGRLPPPIDGRAYTQLVFEETSTTQYYDIRWDGVTPGGYARPIANGEGIPRESSRILAECTYFMNPVAGSLLMEAMIEIIDRVNRDEFRLPAYIGTGIRRVVAPGVARMKGVRTGFIRDLMQITYTLALAGSPQPGVAPHHALAIIENALGEAVETQEIRQYHEADFAPFFP